MKRTKRIAILLGVLAAVCAAAFAAMSFQEEQERIRASDETILALDVDSVTALAWDYEDTSLALHKDEVWLYDEDEAFPVDEEKVRALLEPFADFGAAFTIEEVDDYAQYGLDEPICTITVTAGEQTYTVTLGDYSQMDQQRYVSLGDGNVYLVRHDPLEEFDVALSDLIDHDDLPKSGTVTGLEFSGAEDYSIFREEDSENTYRAEDVYFTQRSGSAQPLDTTRVDGYVSGIRYMDLTNYVSYNVTDQELEAYGLAEPELTVTLEYTYEDGDGQEAADTFVLNISRDPAQAAREEEEEEDSEEEFLAYARVGQSQIVYQIGQTDYEALMAAGYDDLRHLEVFPGDFADVTAVDVTLEGEDYALTVQTPQEGQEADETVWLYREAEVDLTDFQAALEALSADSFTTEDPSGREELRLTLHLASERFPQVEIVLYRHDGAACLAVVDGQPLCYVPRSSVVDLVEAVNAIVLGTTDTQ